MTATDFSFWSDELGNLRVVWFGCPDLDFREWLKKRHQYAIGEVAE